MFNKHTPIKVVVVSGTRPNFVKVAPIFKALKIREEFMPILVHTGQHYNDEMSQIFFRDLSMGKPDHYFGVGSGTHAQQIAKVMLGMEKVLEEEKPNWIVVVGDVNSTMAAAITGVKMGIRTAHVEAGLRSFDRTMPEEINRVLIDSVADLLLTPSEDADENLRREGISASRIVRVGNVMIDSLLAHLPQAQTLQAWQSQGLKEREYILTTLHRPSNVDDLDNLVKIVTALYEVTKDIPVLFPLHPRTADRLKSIPQGISVNGRLHLIPPLGYLAFISILSGARMVLTDSGGVQEEASFLGIPCLTLRDNTERPVTTSLGTNVVIGKEPNKIVPNVQKQLRDDFPAPCSIPLWDGKTAERVALALLRFHRN